MQRTALANFAPMLALAVAACGLATSGLPGDAASSSSSASSVSASSASSTASVGPGGSSSSVASSSAMGTGGAGGGGSGGVGGVAGAGGGCGDQSLVDPEECDDGNQDSGDGCSSTCLVECVGSKVLKDPMTHHCYLLLDLVPLAWQEAEDDCLAIGTHLLALESQEERDAVVPLLDQSAEDVWCGGSDLAQEDTFVWSSGDPWTYDDWAGGDPNGGTAENCVRLDKANSWQWRTIFCDVPPRPYVCERKPAGS